MTQNRPEIQSLLRRLKGAVRRYVLLEGFAATVALACLLFWVTYFIDLGHFRLTNLELSRGFRIVCTVVMITGLAALILTWLMTKLFRRMDSSDLALVLERRFPTLNDRLITAVELAGRSPEGPQSEMLDRTIDEAVSRLTSVRLEETMNPVPLQRMLIAAGVLGVSVVAMGFADPAGMHRWYEAYLLGRNDYWEPFRHNELEVHVVSQPGDRIRSFDSNGVYKHPRGADLQLVATVPEKVDVPDRVLMKYVGHGGAGQQRGQVNMARQGDAEFRHPLMRVVNDHELWFRGGDYVNRQPFRVQVVPPPQLESIELECNYPSYTGMDSLEDQLVKVVGVQVALPMETEFTLVARANKPLVRVIVRGTAYELEFGFKQQGEAQTSSPTLLRMIDTDSRVIRMVSLQEGPATFFNADRTSFRIPLKVSTHARDEIAAWKETAVLPLPVIPDEVLQITLEDEDEITSLEPANLTINGIVDQPPVVETRRVGIGTAVTRMATIPIEGKIQDDYGVEAAWFGYRTDGEETERQQSLAHVPAGRKEFRLQQSPDVEREYFNLIPLQLQEGQKFMLSVVARDGDNLNGPHESRGELFTFQIVSEDELLARLADREMTLRGRFEQIRTEAGDLRTLIEQLQGQIAELEASGNLNAANTAVTAGYVDRGLHQIRKNHTESRSIEVSFRDLREEMVNNRVATAELQERIERRVIEPMSLLNANDFLQVDHLLGALQLAIERRQGMSGAAEPLLPAMDRLLAQMDAILAEMKDRGTLNDVILNLQRMIELQQKLLEETENKRIEDSFFTPLK